MQRKGLSFRAFYWCALLLAILISTGCSSSYTNKNKMKDAGMDVGLNTNIDSDSGETNPQDSSTSDAGHETWTQVAKDTGIGSEDATGIPLDAEKPSDQSEAAVDASTSESAFPVLSDAGDVMIIPDIPSTITGGLEPGERAPAPGEAPPNAYGKPAKSFRIPGVGIIMPDMSCETGGEGASHEPGTLPESLRCVDYHVCTIPCTQDSDCSDGGSGNARAECCGAGQVDPLGRPAGKCQLICEEDTICPDGMVCIFGRRSYDPVYADYTKAGFCMWPVDAAIPGCPAWCELDPVPKGCPGWCAALGVGCDPDVEDYCCEGLVCNPHGWCVEEGS